MNKNGIFQLINESIIYMSRHFKDPIGTGNSATAILMWKPFNSAKWKYT